MVFDDICWFFPFFQHSTGEKVEKLTPTNIGGATITDKVGPPDESKLGAHHWLTGVVGDI